MKVLLDASCDEEGNVWIDAAAPIELLTENTPPHRIAIRTSAKRVDADTERVPIWLRFERPQAHHLIDLLNGHLASADQKGAEKIVKNTVLKSPLNGGVNSANGKLVLLFEGISGLRHRFELPFDQSGAMLEIVERASKAAAQWADKKLSHPPGPLEQMELQPRGAESMLLGEEPGTGRSILSVRLVEGHQFSFFLDRKIVEQIRIRNPSVGNKSPLRSAPYGSVAEDIEWFRDQWCTVHIPPADDELLRGSAVIRSLLVEKVVGRAWRHHGFHGQPRLLGPDVEALAEKHGFELRHAASLIAGGGTVNGITAAMIASVRAFNEATGNGPDDDEGFSVQVSSILRDAREPETVPNELSELTRKLWPLSDYLESTAAVRVGTKISCRNIVKYFANYCGGVHMDKTKAKSNRDLATYKLIDTLSGKVIADVMDGLYFELLSIGQSIGSSPDLLELAKRIRLSADDA
jgi:hypothetical protein